ncbi:MAG TPA: sigma-70 family RNA polymerase sigma factor [Opitutaceae bacterium]|nr:sigma-70 family RNA polymerase sigma factor [Opitutaceae bacterium]
MNPDPTNDCAQLAALQHGDDMALNRLIARWERPLFAFAWRYVRHTADARDLVAEVFVRLYQQRSRLRPDTNLSAWLFTTLANLCHNQHRWRRRHPTVSLDAAEEDGGDGAGADALPAAVPVPGESLERDEARAALGAAIDRLPHELKVTLLLHHYDELSYREIGEITGCSERGVETRLYRARQRLRLELATFLPEAVES